MTNYVCMYSLWVAVKEKSNKDKSVTMEHLKANIRDAITQMRPHIPSYAKKLVWSNKVLWGHGSHINEIIVLHTKKKRKK